MPSPYILLLTLNSTMNMFRYGVCPDIEQAYTVSHAIHAHESCMHVAVRVSTLKCIYLTSLMQALSRLESFPGGGGEK